MLGLKLNHVSKRGHSLSAEWYRNVIFIYMYLVKNNGNAADKLHKAITRSNVSYLLQDVQHAYRWDNQKNTRNFCHLDNVIVEVLKK